MAEVTAFLWALATLRGAMAVLENPTGSVIFHYGPKVPTEALDHRPHQMGAVEEMEEDMVRQEEDKLRTEDERLKEEEKAAAGEAVIENRTAGRTSGTAALRASQAYPPVLGDWVIDTWIALGSSLRPCPASPKGTKRVAGETDVAARSTTPRVSGSGTAAGTPGQPTGPR